MRIFVAATDNDCVAHAALTAENVPHAVHRCEGQLGYSQLLTRLWQYGDTFVLLEDDIVPWPGAVDELSTCTSPWCAFDYPLGNGQWMSACAHLGMGIFKVSRTLIQERPELWREWDEAPWLHLDKYVTDALSLVTGSGPHWHNPPVGHAKHYRKG